MAGKYRTFGAMFDRIFRNNLNANFDDIDTDIQAQKTRVDNLIVGTPQPSEVVDARGGFPVLSDRLADTATQLAEKAKENIFSSYEEPGVVTIIDDDGHAAFLGLMKPTLDANGVKCTLCITVVESNGAPTNGMMIIEQLKSLEAEGYEIASHGSNGQLVSMTEEQVIADLETAKNFVNSHNFKAKEIIVYNEGNWFTSNGRMVKKNVRKYFKYAFNSFGDNNLFVDNFMIGRTDFNAKTLDELKALVDECYEKKTYLVIMTHSWTPEFDATKLDAIIKYIQSKGIKILPATEATKLKCNYIDYGDNDIYGGTRVDANGRLTFNVVTLTDTSINKGIEEYPYGVSYAKYDSFISGVIPQPSGLKDYSWAGYAGSITIIKTSVTNCHQHLILNYPTRLHYTRNWDTNTNSWTEFKPDFSFINIDVIANSDVFKNISNYDKNVVTEFRVAGGTNTPNSEAGVIQVRRSADDTYSYMEFTPYNAAQKYKSIWNTGTSLWGSWLLY